MAVVATSQDVRDSTADGEFTITNYTADLAMDCDTAVVAETNDILGEVIRQLINKGILKGSVATA